MVRSMKWTLVPFFVLFLTSCEGGFENTSDGSGTGGDTTTAEGVVLVLGTGSGSSFESGKLSLASSSLSAGGETKVTVNLVDKEKDNQLYQGVPLTVEFKSGCVNDETAEFSSPTVVTSGGQVETTYRALGCVGTDSITAQVDKAIASANVSISPADVGAIGFNAVQDAAIAYDGFWVEGLPSVTSVIFTLRDGQGNVVIGQEVEFSLTSSIQNEGQPELVKTTATSDEKGLVTARVRAGTLGTSVRVIATHTTSGGEEISTTSSPIAVNTGPPHAEGFSIHSDNFAPEAFDRVGEAGITVYASDKNQNPVADGTVIGYWSEYGQIVGSCETLEGRCSVTWNSSGQLGSDSGPGQLPTDGLTTMHAWTVGEDTFHDRETVGINGLFDSTDLLISTPERFYDRNFNLSYDNDGTEEYVDYDGNEGFTASSPLMRGFSCSESAKSDGHCAQGVEVWAQQQVVMATSSLILLPLASPDPTDVLSPARITGTGTYYFSVQDGFGHQAPTGTTLSASAKNGTVELETTSVADGGRTTADVYMYTYEEGDEGPLVAPLTIKATTPSGVTSALTIDAAYDFEIVNIVPSVNPFTGLSGSIDVTLSMESGEPVPDYTSITISTTKGTATFAGGVTTDYVINGNTTLTINYTSDNASPTRGFITVIAETPSGTVGSAVIVVED